MEENFNIIPCVIYLSTLFFMILRSSYTLSSQIFIVYCTRNFITLIISNLVILSTNKKGYAYIYIYIYIIHICIMHIYYIYIYILSIYIMYIMDIYVSISISSVWYNSFFLFISINDHKRYSWQTELSSLAATQWA